MYSVKSGRDFLTSWNKGLREWGTWMGNSKERTKPGKNKSTKISGKIQVFSDRYVYPSYSGQIASMLK